MDAAIGLCAAISMALGELLDNLILWLMIGLAIGVVSEATTQC